MQERGRVAVIFEFTYFISLHGGVIRWWLRRLVFSDLVFAIRWAAEHFLVFLLFIFRRGVEWEGDTRADFWLELFAICFACCTCFGALWGAAMRSGIHALCRMAISCTRAVPLLWSGPILFWVSDAQ